MYPVKCTVLKAIDNSRPDLCKKNNGSILLNTDHIATVTLIIKYCSSSMQRFCTTSECLRKTLMQNLILPLLRRITAEIYVLQLSVKLKYLKKSLKKII